jgi:hypothetical protein
MVKHSFNLAAACGHLASLEEYWCVHTCERALALELERADIAGIFTFLAIRVSLGSRKKNLNLTKLGTQLELSCS